MNKFYSIILFVLISLTGFGQGSNLTVFSEDGERFYLILNGIRQNENPETNIKVNGLANPYYSAKVIFEKKGIPEVEKKMLPVQDAMNPGAPYDVIFKLKKNKDATFSLKMYSTVPLAQAPAPMPNIRVVQYNTQPMPPIGVSVTQTTQTTTTTGGMGNNVNVGMNVGGVNVGINVSDMMGAGSVNQVSQTTTTTTTTTTGAPVNQINHYDQNHYSSTPPPSRANSIICPMPSREYQDLLASVKGQSFDDNKMQMAKQGTKVNCPTVDQIREIAKQMMMDEGKLEYIKYAYDFCYNKKDYYKLSNTFSFSGTVDEFNQFLGQ